MADSPSPKTSPSTPWQTPGGGRVGVGAEKTPTRFGSDGGGGDGDGGGKKGSLSGLRRMLESSAFLGSPVGGMVGEGEKVFSPGGFALTFDRIREESDAISARLQRLREEEEGKEEEVEVKKVEVGREKVIGRKEEIREEGGGSGGREEEKIVERGVADMEEEVRRWMEMVGREKRRAEVAEKKVVELEEEMSGLGEEMGRRVNGLQAEVGRLRFVSESATKRAEEAERDRESALREVNRMRMKMTMMVKSGEEEEEKGGEKVEGEVERGVVVEEGVEEVKKEVENWEERLVEVKKEVEKWEERLDDVHKEGSGVGGGARDEELDALVQERDLAIENAERERQIARENWIKWKGASEEVERLREELRVVVVGGEGGWVRQVEAAASRAQAAAKRVRGDGDGEGLKKGEGRKRGEEMWREAVRRGDETVERLMEELKGVEAERNRARKREEEVNARLEDALERGREATRKAEKAERELEQLKRDVEKDVAAAASFGKAEMEKEVLRLREEVERWKGKLETAHETMLDMRKDGAARENSLQRRLKAALARAEDAEIAEKQERSARNRAERSSKSWEKKVISLSKRVEQVLLQRKQHHHPTPPPTHPTPTPPLTHTTPPPSYHPSPPRHFDLVPGSSPAPPSPPQLQNARRWGVGDLVPEVELEVESEGEGKGGGGWGVEESGDEGGEESGKGLVKVRVAPGSVAHATKKGAAPDAGGVWWEVPSGVKVNPEKKKKIKEKVKAMGLEPRSTSPITTPPEKPTKRRWKGEEEGGDGEGEGGEEEEEGEVVVGGEGRSGGKKRNLATVELALRKVLLAGPHLLQKRSGAIQAAQEADAEGAQVLIVFRATSDPTSSGVLALVAADPGLKRLRRIWGRCPSRIHDTAIRGVYKFNTASKTFTTLPTLTITPTADAISIHPR